jgi:hypothetical protein
VVAAEEPPVALLPPVPFDPPVVSTTVELPPVPFGEPPPVLKVVLTTSELPPVLLLPATAEEPATLVEMVPDPPVPFVVSIPATPDTAVVDGLDDPPVSSMVVFSMLVPPLQAVRVRVRRIEFRILDIVSLTYITGEEVLSQQIS